MALGDSDTIEIKQENNTVLKQIAKHEQSYIILRNSSAFFIYRYYMKLIQVCQVMENLKEDAHRPHRSPEKISKQ